MIDAVTSQAALNNAFRLQSQADGITITPQRTPGLEAAEALAGGEKSGSFADVVGKLIESVDAKGKVAEGEARRLMLGESDNIHRSMIAMQEAGVAFTLLVEVRNKLVESYQELMRMPV